VTSPDATIAPTSAPPQVVDGRRIAIALAAILTCQLMLVLDSAVVTVALPDIQTGLGLSTTTLSWVQNGYMLAFGGLLMLGGRAGDVFGRRRMFLIGLTVFTISSLIGGFANSAELLLFARVAQGVGAAAAAPSTLALIVSTFSDAERRTRAIALYSTVTGAGAALGLVLGGVLTDGASWRWVFFVNVPFGIAVLALAPLVIQEPARLPGRLDVPGGLTATLGACSAVFGFIRAASDGWSDPAAVIALVAAVVLLAGFVGAERRSREPLVPLGLLANRTRGSAYLVLLLVAAAMFGMFFFLTLYFQSALGYSPLRTGFAFLPFAVVTFVGATFVPRIVAKVGAPAVLSVGILLVAGGLLWLTQVSTEANYFTDALGPMCVFGLGGGFALVVLSLAILGGVPERDSGAASGLLQAMQQIGGSLGTAVLITFFNGAVERRGGEAGPGSTGHAPLVHGVAVTMGVAAVFVLVALVIALAGIRLPKAAPSAEPAADPA